MPLSLVPDSEADDVLDLTDTMRGAKRVAAVAGIGWEDASFVNMSEPTESRMSDGEIEAMVYRVSRLSELIDDDPDHVLSRRSPGRKNRASPSLLSGLFGACDRW